MPFTYPNTVTVEVVQSLFGQPLVNILKFQMESPLTVAEMSNLGIAIESWIETEWAAGFSSQLVFEGLIITSIDLSAPLQVFWAEGFPHAGGDVAESAPVNCAAMTRLYTGFIGATKKGRLYSSGLPITQVDGNDINPTLRSTLEDAANELIADLTLTAWTWVVASGLGQEGPGTGVTTPVLTCQVDGAVHDMGRRLDN